MKGRKITISIMAPVTVELLMELEDEDWVIDSVLRSDFRATVTPRSVYENADSETLDEIYRLAAAAEDIDDDKPTRRKK